MIFDDFLLFAYVLIFHLILVNQTSINLKLLLMF